MNPDIRIVAAFALILTAVFVFAMSGPAVADSKADFNVTMDTSAAVDGNSTLTVAVTVTNEGNVSDTQEIELTGGNGSVQDSTNVSLGAGQSASVTLNWTNVPVPEASPAPDYERTITPKVSSENDADSTVVTVRWSYFEVDSITPTTKTLVNGTSFNLSSTVRNVGTLDGTKDVRLLIDGTEYDRQAGVSIDAEGATQLSFSDIDPPVGPGVYNYTVETPDESVSGTLTILEAAQFTITALDAVNQNETVTVDATIRNDESIAAEQPVVLDVDGRDVDQQNVSLAPGETTDVTFTYDAESLPLNATVQTELDSDSIRVGTVEILSMDGTYEDDIATVTTVVENQDPAGTDQTVVFKVDGEQVETQAVFLSPNEQTTLTFSYDPDTLPANVTALTDIDAASVSIPNATIANGPRVERVTPDRLDSGESVTVNYTAAGVNVDEVRLRVAGPDGSRLLDEAVSPGTNQEFTLSQSALTAYKEGEYDVTVWVKDEFGGTDTDTLENAFEATALIENGPAVEQVEPDTVTVDETVFIDYSATGVNIEDVSLQLEGPEGTVVYDATVPQGVDRRIEIDPNEIDAIEEGPHTVRVVVTDVFGNVETATEEDAFEMAPIYNPDNADFSSTESSTDGGGSTYEGIAGDFVTVSVTLNEIEEAYIIVGGDRSESGEESDAPLDVLHVSGSATFIVNTRLVGTDRPGEEVYIPVDGEVTSYAHDLGPDTVPPNSSVFADLAFQNAEYEQVAETLSGYRQAAGAQSQIRPLQPGAEVSMVIGGGDSLIVTDDGFPDARYPLDRGKITLTRPSLEAVTTYRLPPGNADERSFTLDSGDAEELEPGSIETLVDDATEAGTVARDDRLLIEVEATGLYGALLDSLGGSQRLTTDGASLIEPTEFKRLFDRPEGIALEIAHLNPGPNVPENRVDLFNGSVDDVSIILAPPFGESPTEMQRFYVLVDTRELEPFDRQPEGGDRYEVRMRYTAPGQEGYRFKQYEQGDLPAPFDPQNEGLRTGMYPYLQPGVSNVTRTSTFEIENRFIEYDRTTDDGRPVVANTATTISGQTNLAPGSDLPVNIVIDVRDEPTTVEITDVTIEEDGTFAVQPDLSTLNPGDAVDIEFWAYQEKLDERQLAVVDQDEVGGTFQIQNLTVSSVVTINGTVTQMAAVVTNTGVLPDTKPTELLLDGEVVANRSLSLDPGETRTLQFDDVMRDIDTGEYTLEVRTPDDIRGRILVVEAPETAFEVTGISATSTVTDSEAGIDFETTVRNTGTINGTETVELLREGEVIGERTPRLLAGQDVTYTFADELAELGPGNYTLTVRTPTDERSVEVTVEDPTAVFNVTGVDVTGAVQRGETISPTAVINNTGTVAGNSSVTVSFDGETIDNASVSLSASANETVAFAETVVDSEPGTYTLRIETPDDAVTREVVVDPSADNETTENATETSDDAEEPEVGGEESREDGQESDGSGPAVFGLGSRRTAIVGGTAVVAGIHVLGYWV